MFDEPDEVELSDEQQAAVKSICEQKNTVVFAKAGCGKTTASLEVARMYFRKYRKRALLLTYNSALKEETRARIFEMGLGHIIEAHSFHAAAYKYFQSHDGDGGGGGGGATDQTIHDALSREPSKPIDVGLIILDEAQDMSPTYAKFVQHILTFVSPKPVMLILGDRFQQIFRFSGASIDYMRHPSVHFGHLLLSPGFVNLHFSISFRITHEMAEFINENLNPNNLQYVATEEEWAQEGPFIAEAWGRGIRANPKRDLKPGSVRFEMVNPYEAKQTFVPYIAELIEQYGGSQVALLSRTLSGERKTGASPLSKILEALSKADNENWIALHGSKKLLSSSQSAQRVLKDKRVCSTIHRMKGIERSAIVVVGLDHFFEKGCQDIYEHLDLFNLFYVACTRAKDQLVVWKVNQGDYVTIRRTGMSSSARSKPVKPKSCYVENLVSYTAFDPTLDIPGAFLKATPFSTAPVPSSSSDEVKTIEMNDVPDGNVLHGIERIDIAEEDVLMPGRSPGTVEDLSHVLSTAIEIMTYFRCHNEVPQVTYDDLLSRFENMEPADELWRFLSVLYSKKLIDITWPDIVRVAIVKICLADGFIHTWRQLNHAELDKWLENATPLLETSVENTRLWLYKLLGIAPPAALEDGDSGPRLRSKSEKSQWHAQWNLLRRHLKFWQLVNTVSPYPWFNRRYSDITGEMHIVLSNGIIVQLSIGQGLQMADVQTVQACKILDPSHQGKEAVVIVANLGECYSIGYADDDAPGMVSRIFRNDEFIYRLLRRRMLMPVEEHKFPPIVSVAAPKRTLEKEKETTTTTKEQEPNAKRVKVAA